MNADQFVTAVSRKKIELFQLRNKQRARRIIHQLALQAIEQRYGAIATRRERHG